VGIKKNVTEEKKSRPTPIQHGITDCLETLGRFAYFAAQCLAALPGALRRPGEVTRHLFHVYVGALPLGIVAGLSLGAVIWMHLHGVLVRLGSGYTTLLPQYLALAVVLEFAPLGAGFIVAGRSGANLAAELGAMRITEQMDALEVMGQSPMRLLVAPRVLACSLALPLLTVMIGMLAIGGSYVAESLGGTMSWQEYANATLRDLRVKDMTTATLKTVVFGFLIGITGCYVGMTAEGGTEGVGRAATRGVVWSIFVVVVSDVLLVRLIQLFG
jgi:phospholipid/cholesterol/gamma-HCH transport system permease protein